MWNITFAPTPAGLNQQVVDLIIERVTAAAAYYDRYIDTSLATIDIRIEFPQVANPLPFSVVDWNYHHTTNGVDYYE